jgi:monooxygenase
MMLSGVPNLAMTLGYTNASWTLKADLVAEYVCRLLAHMDRNGHRECRPLPPPPGETLRPLPDFTSGYVERAVGSLPKQGPRAPWLLAQNYVRDIRLFRRAPLEDEAMRFSSPDRPSLRAAQPAGV